jgi:hypothetical protein
VKTGHRSEAFGKHLWMAGLDVMGQQFNASPDNLTNAFNFVLVILDCVKHFVWFSSFFGLRLFKARGKPFVS